MEKIFTLEKAKIKDFMACDICERTHQQFIINLKPERFPKEKGTKKERNARRVCFYCAFYLFRKGIYNFSYVWRETFLDQLKRLGSNDSIWQKYMEIHK